MKIEAITTGGSKGVTGIQVPTPLVQFLSFSCSFWQKSCQIIDFGPNSGVGTPRLGNPGFDTDINTQILSSSPANPYTRGQKFNQQECIPVGCVLPAHSPHRGVSAWGWGVCPEGSLPRVVGCLPRVVGCLPRGMSAHVTCDACWDTHPFCEQNHRQV